MQPRQGRPSGAGTARRGPTGLRRFASLEAQRAWLDGTADLHDADERVEDPELRFKYLPRYRKLLSRTQADEVLSILRIYGGSCLPMPRRTERDYWSVSCLPSTSDKPLVRVNASWMELFTIYADEDGIRTRFLLHLSDFTSDHSAAPGHLDEALIESCVAAPENVGTFIPRGADMLGVKVRGAASIRAFLAHPHALRAIRAFVLTHMNRGRNAYQASHCYSVADHMVEVSPA